jgi:hypothetical protein
MLPNTYTLRFACILDNLANVKEYFAENFKKPENIKMQKGELDIKKVCFPEPPSKRGFEKFVIWEPCNNQGTTVLYSNRRDGLDSWLYNYSLDTHKNCIRTSLFLDKKSEYLPAYKFNYRIGETERHIHAMLDGNKWQFYQKGEPLPFEKPEYYTKRKIRDRLPNELILSYLKELGWDAESPDFWRSEQPAHYFERIAWDSDTEKDKISLQIG